MLSINEELTMEDTVILNENKLTSLLAAAMLGASGAHAATKPVSTNNVPPPWPSISANSDNSTHDKHLAEPNWKSRGLKNNNPGNIKVGGEKWEGVVGNDGPFLVFKSMDYGLRAMTKLLSTYQTKYGLNTIEQIITKFAPKSDKNPTEKYIAEVSKYMGIARTDKINLKNDKTMLDLVNAMVRMETGRDLPDSVVKNGIAMARGPVKTDTMIAATPKKSPKQEKT